MAQFLSNAYNLISKLQSMQGKMALASKTLVPSTKAALEEDTPEIKQKFERAFKEITGMSIAEAEKKVRELEKKV
ncbi:MAG: hypothetical protein V1773_13010 [bacterium]